MSSKVQNRSISNLKSSHAMLDWESPDLPEAPGAPDSLKQAGLSLSFVNDMLLRTLLTRGTMLGLDLARLLCLPFRVIEEPLQFLKHEKCVEVSAGDLIGQVSYKFSLTDVGRIRARDALQ